MLHIGLLHHLEELPRIGAKALDITALPLGIDRIEGKARFARARQARNHDQGIARQINIDAFKIVLSRTANRDFSEHSGGGLLSDREWFAWELSVGGCKRACLDPLSQGPICLGTAALRITSKSI